MSDRQVPPNDTAAPQYTARLERLSGPRWKQLLDVQRPYRWNVRRLCVGEVLDVGCGIGRNLGHLQSRAVGVDHNPESIEVARSRGLRAWTTKEFPTSPDAISGRYQTLLVAHVLEHLPKDSANDVLQQYLTYLRRPARIVLICPQERGFASDATHVRWCHLETLREHATQIGARVTSTASFPFPRAAGRVFAYNEFVLTAELA